MKVLMVNGSAKEKGCTYTALAEIGNTLEQEGIQTEIFWLGGRRTPRLYRMRTVQYEREGLYLRGRLYQ